MTTRRPLIVLANRLPVRREADGWEPSAGGLVTALRPVVEERGGAWVGWDGGEPDVPTHVDGLDVSLHPVALTDEQIHGYYDGFANRTIWPLFHDLVSKPSIDRAWWQTYRDVNAAFAAQAAAVAKQQPDSDALLWVQDYHLMLAPQMLREELPNNPIGFFLHIPFPPPELMAQLPWRETLLRGLLGADVVAFHTPRYRRNFIRSVLRVFPDVVRRGKRLELPDGRVVDTAAHPISIDTAEFISSARAPETEQLIDEMSSQFDGRSVLLGVDRLDYTKGIRHRLQAIDLLLERRPDLRTKVSFIQVAVPSRNDVQEYIDLRNEIEHEVGRINGRFTEPGHDVPVHYMYRGVDSHTLAAYYRLADVMLVTPLKDGMNLVAKEYVVTQGAVAGSGRLVLSEFAGASLELPSAMLCNPFDVEGLSHVIETAIEADLDRAARDIRVMAAQVRKHDVYRWVRSALGRIEKAAAER